MTEDERRTARELLDAGSPSVGGTVARAVFVGLYGATMALFGGTIVLSIAIFVARLTFAAWVVKAQATFALLGLAYALWNVRRKHARSKAKVARLEEDVANGVVEVLDVEAFIAWEEIDREAPAYSFDVAEAQPFFTKGTVLAPLVAAGRFPCRRFTLVRLPGSKVPLACEPRGEPLVPRG